MEKGVSGVTTGQKSTLNIKKNVSSEEVDPGTQQGLVLCSLVLFPGSFLLPFLTPSSVFFSLQPQMEICCLKNETLDSGQ